MPGWEHIINPRDLTPWLVVSHLLCSRYDYYANVIAGRVLVNNLDLQAGSAHMASTYHARNTDFAPELCTNAAAGSQKHFTKLCELCVNRFA